MVGVRAKVLGRLGRKENSPSKSVCSILPLARYLRAGGGVECVNPGPQLASIKAQRDELIAFLNEWADGVWPPAPGSGLREVEQLLDCGLGTALDAVEAALKKHAA